MVELVRSRSCTIGVSTYLYLGVYSSWVWSHTRHLHTDGTIFLSRQKTPFAGPDGNTDLGRFFRDVQVAPSLDMFREQASIEETLNAITDQLATFEMNASQFNEFLDSLQDDD